MFTFTISEMMSHRILITTEYLNAHFFSVFISVYVLQVLKALFYANFVNSVDRLNSPVYSAPPCNQGLRSFQRTHLVMAWPRDDDLWHKLL